MPVYMLAGSGANGAPVKLIEAVTCFPSGKKFPDCRSDFCDIQPVRLGLISIEHDPMSLLGATGGNGSSMTSIGSGIGGGGNPSARSVLALLE